MRLFIDTDTASDDAVALVMALRHPQVEVVGIGVVAGNVPLQQAVQNALFVVEMCEAQVPVLAGADRPLRLPLDTAQHVHGRDGMGDIGLPLHGRSPSAGNPVDGLVEASHRYAGELTLVTLGPLTNIALALGADPSLASRIERCVVMGGASDHVGNMTPAAEYNVWADPHAFDIVLGSGLPLELVGWDISRKYAVLGPDEAAAVRALGTPLAELCIDIQTVVTDYALTETKLPGFDLPDPIAMAYAIDPSVGTDVRRLHCAVETESSLTRGMVVVDLLGLTQAEPNARVVVEASRERFLAMLHQAVA